MAYDLRGWQCVGQFLPFALRCLLTTHSNTPQSHYDFLSNQLLVDTIYLCYTFPVTRKRSPARPPLLTTPYESL
jgi:hypothetical protein